MSKVISFKYILPFVLLLPEICTVPQEEILPEGCEELLELFANDTAKFTMCVVTNARPIRICENCVNEYYQVKQRYENIQRLHHNDSKIDCPALLNNIDRLHVVLYSYDYVINMWKKASCSLCLNDKVPNDQTKHVMMLGKLFESCISNHINSSNSNSTVCVDCKGDYLNLTNYYNEYKKTREFCMDVVDLINITQIEWSIELNCHVPNYKSDWTLIVIASAVLLAPILFYLVNWLMSKERSNVLLSQNRWQERFIHSSASTSGYVSIS
ncbi:osteopetrosis-associated transmembrane protein 1 isoform X2 [Adelges cooleyi]|uniref:osteopetrosis-associated transmembrane protein 1 isoform X2 n=1 Tax=Adelges cooleyi TaxID=133065 RepID=UPI0021805481|nr:osteopetrosis-associated transmembrane protein 1 isoform X2 [Adelges cooleyi]